MNTRASACFILLAWLAVTPANLVAERMVISGSEMWESWTYPAGAVRLEEGILRPVLSRKQVNAALEANIRGAGTGQSAAGAVIDGDLETGWSPDPTAPLEDWWIEIDMGQVRPTQQIRLFFDEKSAPLSFFKVFLSKGERFINSANVVVDGTLLYNRTERFSLNEDHSVSIDFDNELVQVVRIEASRAQEGTPTLNEIEIETFGDNVAFDLIENGGSVTVEAAVVTQAGSPATMFDGDLVSFWQVVSMSKGTTGGGETFGDYRIDLGAVYWIDAIWILGDPIGIAARNRYLYGNFLSYRILYSDGSLAPDGSLAWTEQTSIPADPENLYTRRNFQHEFPPVAARYLRLQYPTSAGGSFIGGGDWGDAGLTRVLYGLGLVGEFQVFGEGHPARVVLRSPVIDLVDEWNITSLEWLAKVPAGAEFLLRSRSGDEVEDDVRYFDKNGKEVTQKKWEKLIKSFRGPVETRLKSGSDWSPWSEEYLVPGTAFRSPSPRRYFQLEVELLAFDPLAGTAVEELVVNFTRPLAGQAIGEIFPQQVDPGMETDFTYYLNPSVASQNLGFDQIALESSIPITFREIRVDGIAVDAAYSETEDGFRLELPAQVSQDGLFEIDFAAVVFQNRTRFRGFLERQGGALRQQVDPGDAVSHLEGAGDAVSLPVDEELLSGLELHPRIFTPNGDGRNDRLEITFNVLKLFAPRPVCAWIYDLRGRPVRRLSEESGLAGSFALSWDGRDDSGTLVPPGMYLFRLEVSGDSTRRAITRTLAVSY